jgi:hypothetical protein
MKRNTQFALVVVSLIAVLALPVMAQFGPPVVKTNSVAYGRTYGEWSAAWWQWAFSIPVASHPLFDNGDCSVGQSGPVWFLGGRFCQTGQPCNGAATRSCKVPVGKALYFPLNNVADTAPEEPNWGCGNSLPPLVGGTIAEMRQCVASFIDQVTGLEADLDGEQIHNIKSNFRVQSPQFDVTWPEDNVLTAIGEGPFSAGTYSPVIDDGYYLLLEPLSPGIHTLHFQAGSQGITYHLTVLK